MTVDSGYTPFHEDMDASVIHQDMVYVSGYVGDTWFYGLDCRMDSETAYTITMPAPTEPGSVLLQIDSDAFRIVTDTSSLQAAIDAKESNLAYTGSDEISLNTELDSSTTFWVKNCTMNVVNFSTEGALINTGTIEVLENGTLYANGRTANYGGFTVNGSFHVGDPNHPNATFSSSNSFTTSGSLSIYGTFSLNGHFTANSGLINIYGTCYSEGITTLENGVTLWNNEDGTLENLGNMTNNGLINNKGSLTNTGILQNDGTINNWGTITGTIQGNQPVNVNSGGAVPYFRRLHLRLTAVAYEK